MTSKIIHIENVPQVHRIFGLPKEKNPLISVVRHSDIVVPEGMEEVSFSMSLYVVSFKGNQKAQLTYGRNSYDFQEGTIIFFAPGQVYSAVSADFSDCTDEWTILFHPDFLLTSNLGDQIDQYHFFTYEVNEALHISEDEKKSLNDFVVKIEKECNQNVDRYTQELIAINLESILKYCQRYYERQFITRRHFHQDYIIRFEKFLKDYFSHEVMDKGIPTVTQCGEAMNMSGHYLSDLLKAETGKSAKEYIDLQLVTKAKNLLINSRKSVSEVAYTLGFNYPNHFSKLFKSKTGYSPSIFRNIT